MRWLCSSQDRDAKQEGTGWHGMAHSLAAGGSGADGSQAGWAEVGSRPTQFLPQGLIVGLLVMAPGMGWQLPKGRPGCCTLTDNNPKTC